MTERPEIRRNTQRTFLALAALNDAIAPKWDWPRGGFDVGKLWHGHSFERGQSLVAAIIKACKTWVNK